MISLILCLHKHGHKTEIYNHICSWLFGIFYQKSEMFLFMSINLCYVCQVIHDYRYLHTEIYYSVYLPQICSFS